MMALVAFALLTSSATGAECPGKSEAGPATLVVQAVDELWLPLPGAAVTVRLHGRTSECISGTTDDQGFVRIAIANKGVYDVEAALVGFKATRIRRIDVDADPAHAIPHVQIKLKVAASKEII